MPWYYKTLIIYIIFMVMWKVAVRAAIMGRIQEINGGEMEAALKAAYSPDEVRGTAWLFAILILDKVYLAGWFAILAGGIHLLFFY